MHIKLSVTLRERRAGLLRFGGVTVLRWRTIGGGVAAAGTRVKDFMRVVGTMSHDQRIRSIGLVVWHDT
ncbi:hypothetical protein D3C73_1242020 [compost metagenome]